MRAAALILALSTTALAEPPSKKAYLFLSPHLTGSDRDEAAARRQGEHDYFRAQGYEPIDKVADEQTILDALWEGVPGLGFFGHGGHGGWFESPEPSFDSLSADAWRRVIARDFRTRYLLEKRFTDEEIDRLVEQRVQNLGLELFRNWSCQSSANLSIAQLFVKPGGLYYGTRRTLIDSKVPGVCGVSCVCTLGYYRYSLTEYKVTEEMVAPADADWALSDTSLYVFDPDKKDYVSGKAGKTPTSEWWIAADSCRFDSKLDGFHLSASWTRPPRFLKEGKGVLMVVEADARGPRKTQIGLSPVGPICEWGLELQKNANSAVETPLKFLKCKNAPRSKALRLEIPAGSEEKPQPQGWMELEITPRAKLVGSAVDSLILELNCNGAAKLHWTYKKRQRE